MPQRAANKIKRVRAVDRAIAILKAFSTDMSSMSVVEIEKKVGLNRPTVYRLLETLASHNLIRVHGTPQRFSLDYGVGQLAQSWMAGLDPVAAAQPIVERLHAETKETVGLMIVRGHERFSVLELRSSQELSMAFGIGPAPLGRGSSGKSILAFMSEQDIEAILRTLPKGTDKKALLAELADVRRDKFRVSRGEVIKGALGISAPYFDHANRVVGAIQVLGPEVRFNEERISKIAKRVVESAVELSAALGHSYDHARKSATRTNGE